MNRRKGIPRSLWFHARRGRARWGVSCTYLLARVMRRFLGRMPTRSWFSFRGMQP